MKDVVWPMPRLVQCLRHYDRQTAVFGAVERGGRVRATVIPDRSAETLGACAKAFVLPSSVVFTDEWAPYVKAVEGYAGHHRINHSEKVYVDGNVHTNSLENFWSLLKRSISGTYVSVEPFHLFRYLDEQSYRFNNRKLTDAERFSAAVSGAVGKRVTWDQLTGKTEQGVALL